MAKPGEAARTVRYFSRPEQYLANNYRVLRRIEIVAQLIGSANIEHVIDLGCGDGSVAASITASRRTLVDSSAGMIASARSANPQAECHVADVLSYHGETANLVLALGVLAHIGDNDGLFAVISRHLPEGGRAIVQFSPAERASNRLAGAIFGLRARLAGGLRYRPTPTSEIIAAARRYGLVPIDARDHLLVLPGMARLLGQALLPYDRAVAGRPWLARHGLDRLVLFEKA
jgi:predicted TPR repeat methyltransferase